MKSNNNLLTQNFEQTLYYFDVANDLMETIDDGRRESAGVLSERLLIGANARIWLEDPSIHVAYQDSSHMRLYTASRQGVGYWPSNIREGEGRGSEYKGGFGFYLDKLTLGDTLYIVDMVINMQTDGRPIQPQLHLYSGTP